MGWFKKKAKPVEPDISIDVRVLRKHLEDPEVHWVQDCDWLRCRTLNMSINTDFGNPIVPGWRLSPDEKAYVMEGVRRARINEMERRLEKDREAKRIEEETWEKRLVDKTSN